MNVTSAGGRKCDDPLRLEFCPNCDYSRESIADGAPCPECGMRCDSSVIVLQDDIGDLTEPVWRKRRRWIGWTMVGLVCAFVLFKIVARGNLGALVGFWPIGVMILLACWHRLFSWSRAHAQLWLHEQGVELTTSTEESRRAARISQIASFAYAPVMLLLLGFTSRNREMFWFMLALITVIIVGTAFTWYLTRLMNPRFTLRIGDFERSLIPWRAIIQIEVLKPAPGRVRVRCRHRVRLLGPMDHSQPWLQVEAPCDDARYDALQDRLYTWRARAR
jgi:hypothetical protein